MVTEFVMGVDILKLTKSNVFFSRVGKCSICSKPSPKSSTILNHDHS